MKSPPIEMQSPNGPVAPFIAMVFGGYGMTSAILPMSVPVCPMVMYAGSRAGSLGGYDEDPGWYQHPPGTVALKASEVDLARDGINVKEATAPGSARTSDPVAR